VVPLKPGELQLVVNLEKNSVKISCRLGYSNYVLTVVLFCFCHRVNLFEVLLSGLTLRLLGRPNASYQFSGSEVNGNNVHMDFNAEK
jgi:hypothetical protein